MSMILPRPSRNGGSLNRHRGLDDKDAELAEQHEEYLRKLREEQYAELQKVREAPSDSAGDGKGLD